MKNISINSILALSFLLATLMVVGTQDAWAIGGATCGCAPAPLGYSEIGNSCGNATEGACVGGVSYMCRDEHYNFLCAKFSGCTESQDECNVTTDHSTTEGCFAMSGECSFASSGGCAGYCSYLKEFGTTVITQPCVNLQ